MEKLDRLGWAVRSSYEVDGLAFGVRTNSEAFAAWMDEALAAYSIPDELPSYYSILIADEGKPGKRFHLLYEETKVLARSRNLETIARALLSQLELLLLPERDDAIYAEMTVFAANGRRALAPGLVLPLLEAYSHRELERSGIVLPCSTTVAIDPGTGDLVPMPPVLDLPPDALERLPRFDMGDVEPRIVVDRAFAVDAVVSLGDPTASVGPVSKAAALYRTASHSLNLGRIGDELALKGLRKTVERAGCFELTAGDWRSLLGGLASVLRP
jgi:hypothetical protein